MPSRQYLKQQAMNREPYVSVEWFVEQIREPKSNQVLILDCRSQSEFNERRIRGAINVALPASIIMLRRLANGKVLIPSVIKDNEGREKFTKMWKTNTIVVYDADSEEIRPSGHCVLATVFRRLEQDGCQVFCLQGGFRRISSHFPEWCESSSEPSVGVEPSLLGLESLRISSASSDTDSDGEGRCDSGLPPGEAGSPNDPPFPVEILPHLFLGNADNASDLEALEKHGVRYVLNVTPNLPNTFEHECLGFRYMQIPIQDHWSQNLASFFPEAISFIEEARQKKLGVLVHCLAGISRSVTITLAYLMHKLHMPLNDAYDFVRQRKANISPNFNFMGQLMDFERQLNLTPGGACLCGETPCTCRTLHFTSPTRTTPDSGIDMDRWT